jgi:hypothetical protein
MTTRLDTEFTGPRQAIHTAVELAGHVELSMSATELFAVLRCAGSLAHKEGMTRTGDRLYNDAELVRQLSHDSTVKSIQITVTR